LNGEQKQLSAGSFVCSHQFNYPGDSIFASAILFAVRLCLLIN